MNAKEYKQRLDTLADESNLTLDTLCKAMNFSYIAVYRAIKRENIQKNHIQALNLVNFLHKEKKLNKYIKTLD